MKQFLRIPRILFFLPLLFPALAPAQSSLYSMASVPESVKANAAVIKHSEKIHVEIETVDKAIYSVHQVYTVLNESGKSALLFNEYTSSHLSLTEAEIRVFDSNGKQIARHKKKDMTTVGYGDGLIDDGYYTYFRIQTNSYPVTVELKTEMRLKGTLFLPDYHFVEAKTGVVASDYTISAPAEMNIRFKPVLTDIQPVVSTEKNRKVYRWAVNSLPPYVLEEGSAAGNRMPHVMIVADQFSYGGYKGDFSSWSKFGEWYYNLCAGLDQLSPERQNFFRELVKNAPDEVDKVRRIYQYLQDNFRFVSISLGVGDLRPLSAAFTDKQKYGDCKALSNFTKAALNAVGIKSYLAVINRDVTGQPADPQFPANTFNHVILCVPVKNDSIWLECTSTTAEFGELESSTENRNALVVNEQGGFLVATPKSHYSSNLLSSVSTVSIDEDLSAICETNYTTRGYFSEMFSDISKSNRDQQKSALVQYLGFKQPDDFLLTKTSKHSSTVKLSIAKLPDFTASDKVFIPQRVQHLWNGRLPKSEGRQLDFNFSYPFQKTDSVIYLLPKGCSPEALLKDKKLETPYSSYEVNYSFDAARNAVLVTSTLILQQQRIPASDYVAVKKFFDEVTQDHSQKLVIKKGPAPEKKAF